MPDPSSDQKLAPRKQMVSQRVQALDEVKQGDIIIVVGVVESTQDNASERAINQRTLQAQSVVSKAVGLNLATHIGVAHVDGKITHLTGRVAQDSAKDFFQNHPGCSFIIYRPNNPEVSKAIGQVIQQDSAARLYDDVRWKQAASVKCFLPSVFHSGVGFRKLSAENICSKFVLQVMKKAMTLLYPKDPKKCDQLVGVSSNSLPKTVDDYFYRNENYSVRVVPKSPMLYFALSGKIYGYLEGYKKIAEKGDAKDKLKYEKLKVAFDEAVKQIPNDDDDVQKCIKLMVHVYDALSMSRGVLASTKYKEVVGFLNENGIHENDYLAVIKANKELIAVPVAEPPKPTR